MPIRTLTIDLFRDQAIRDTSSHRPREMLDLRRARHWSFDVNNRHDQAVTVQLIGGSTPNAQGAGDVGASVSIAANTQEPIATDIFMPFLAVRIKYATAPTAGFITVTGSVQVETPVRLVEE